MKRFCVTLALTLTVITAVIFLATFIETLRISSDRTNDIGVILDLSLFKIPLILQKLIPFIIFLSNLICLTNLTKTSELIVARASGISAWQFILPIVTSSLLIGVFFVIVMNPIAALLNNKYQKMSYKYLKSSSSILTVSNSKLWLREKNYLHNIIIRADSIQPNSSVLNDVSFFIFDDKFSFIKRINTKSATLEKEYWSLSDVDILQGDKIAQHVHHMDIETKTTKSSLQENFISPDNVSFYEFPSFIENLKNNGFSATRHRLYFYSLLVLPFYLSAMSIISSVFGLRITRKGRSGLYFTTGIMIAFLVYFVNDIFYALGLNGQMPAYIYILTPVISITLIGVVLLLHFEDG